MKKKDRTITFIYCDGVQKMVFELISKKAIEHGYNVKFSSNKFEKCDIGFYCEHINHPENSRFSIVMLHDITQQYSNWPDIWFREPWNKYDIGFLPSDKWKDNWLAASDKFYARPSKGCYVVGWPKADSFIGTDLKEKQLFYKKQFGLDLKKKTILYAPSWENDGKQDDFVKSMMRLDVNILIKQAPWDKKSYPHIVRNIDEMKALHQNLPGVVILDTRTNIMEAICACDVLVSEESSTMLEAIMLGKPAVSVSDWLIPDTTPKRYPSDTYEFVVKTTKDNLTITIDEILNNYSFYADNTKKFSSLYFGNNNNTCDKIIAIIDKVLELNKPTDEAIVPNDNVPLSEERLIAFKKEQKRRIKTDKAARFFVGRLYLRFLYVFKKAFNIKK